jgi:beta-lactamase regulating signal transducer with metallopeptidase domain/predicted  nucleic acid-binding Zn-ribbon protein
MAMALPDDAGLLYLLADAALKSTALLAAVALTSLLMRRAGARSRQLLWAVGLAGVVALPLLAPLMPAWQLGLLHRDLPPAAAVLELPAAPQQRTPPAAGPPWRTAGRSPATVLDSPASPDLAATSARMATEADPSAANALPRRRPIAPLLAMVWLCGALVLTARWLAGHWTAARWARQAHPAGSSWQMELDRGCRQVGLRAEVALLFHPRVKTPMTWGLVVGGLAFGHRRQPVILLPLTADGWNAERRRLVLQHELLHIRRHDWLLRTVAQAACALYWFHPLAWLGLRRLTAEQEQACDEGVLALGTPPSRYADHLLAIARAAVRTRIPLPVVEMAGRSPLEARLMSILSFSQRMPHERRRWLPLLLALALIPTLAALRLWADPAPAVASEAAVTAAATTAATTAATAATTAEASAPQEARRARPVAAPPELRRTLAELAAVEERLRPFEDELEAIEREMEPFEQRLDATEDGFEPYEQELEAIEAGVEPHEARMEEIEREMEPYEERMEAIESEMAPIEARMEQVERSLEPFEERAEQIERQAEPLYDRLEGISEQLEPLAEKLHAAHEAGRHDSAETHQLEQQMEALHAQMAAVQRELEPIHRQMEDLHQQMEPVHRQMEALHEEMEPMHHRMEEVHREMEPIHRRMEEAHHEMEPIHHQMEQVHERMEPIHRQMEAVHQEMEPIHRRMEDVHQRMEPIHQEMERLHERLDGELQGALRTILEEETAGLGVGAEALDRAAARAADVVSVQISDGRLSVRASQPRLRSELAGALGSPADGSPLADAVARSAEAIAGLEILYQEG